MSDREIRGQAVSEEQIQEWAEEAEAGYDDAKRLAAIDELSAETYELGLT